MVASEGSGENEGFRCLLGLEIVWLNVRSQFTLQRERSVVVVVV